MPMRCSVTSTLVRETFQGLRLVWTNAMTGKSGADAVRLIAAFTCLLILPGCTGNLNNFNPIGCGNNCSPPPPSPEFLYATSPNHVLGFTYRSIHGEEEEGHGLGMGLA
jgi:hypothetical protein